MYILDYLLSKPFIESFLLMKCEAPTNYQITRKNNLPFVKIFLFGTEKTIRYEFRSTKLRNSLDYHSFLYLYIKENCIIFTIGYFCLFSKNSFPCASVLCFGCLCMSWLWTIIDFGSNVSIFSSPMCLYSLVLRHE